MQPRQSQADRILAHLQTGASLTPAQAYEWFGTLALHSRIAELRGRGWSINCRLDRPGGGRQWGVYTLVGPQEGSLFDGLQAPASRL